MKKKFLRKKGKMSLFDKQKYRFSSDECYRDKYDIFDEYKKKSFIGL